MLSVVVFLMYASVAAQVKIGSAGTPNSNAVLELDGGTNKGLLLPRLSNAQIIALTTAPDGMMVYNNTDGFLYLRKGAAWQKISDATNAGGGAFALPYDGTSSSTTTAFSVTSTGNADALRGYASAGDGITGLSTTGKGGYFSSSSGSALVTNAGNVGFGTTTPQYPLDINGRVRIRSNGAYNSAGIWYDKIYTAGLGSFVGTLNDSSFGIYGAGDWKFVFDYTNNRLGINQSNPKAPLSFSNATGNKMDIYYSADNSRYGIGLQASLMQFYTGGTGDDIAFGYGSSNVFTENMRIKGNGNVGIGNNNPDAKLLVNGSLKITDGTEGNGKVLTSDANGKASWQSGNANTGFKGLIFSTNFPSGSFVPVSFRFVGNSVFDDGNNWRPGVDGYGYYNSPSAGLYHFDLAFVPNRTPVATIMNPQFVVALYVNAEEKTVHTMPFSTGQSMPNISYSCNIKLNANDRVQVLIYQSSGVTMSIDYTENSFFSGYKVY